MSRRACAVLLVVGGLLIDGSRVGGGFFAPPAAMAHDPELVRPDRRGLWRGDAASVARRPGPGVFLSRSDLADGPHRLSQNRVDDVACHVSEAKAAAVVEIGQSLVVEPQDVQHRRVQVVNAHASGYVLECRSKSPGMPTICSRRESTTANAVSTQQRAQRCLPEWNSRSLLGGCQTIAQSRSKTPASGRYRRA